MYDEDRAKCPEKEKQDARQKHDGKSDERKQNERGTNKEPDNPHEDVDDDVGEKVRWVFEDIDLSLLQTLERRNPAHDDIRNREKVIDEPQIVPPYMHNIEIGNTVVPQEIIAEH